MLLQLLLTPGGYYKQYDKIVIISTTFVHQYEKTWSKIHKKGLLVYNTITEALVKHLMAECESQNISMLLVSDDMCSQWRKGLDQALVDVMISTSRHLGKGLSMVFLSQSIVQLPTSIRRNTYMFCIFGATSFQETHLIWCDVSTINKKDFYSMFRHGMRKQSN